MAVNRITTIFDFKERGQGLKQVKADVAAVDGSLNKAKTGVKGLWGAFAASGPAKAAVAGVAVKLGTDAVNAASALEESINAANVTFGESAEAIGELGEESVDSYGLSERAFNQMAVSFSGFAEQIAGEGGNVAQVVDDMATRIADFASVQDLTVDEAMTKFQSALAGETEAMRRYGIDVSAATVKTHAYEKGIAEAGSELTEQQKVMARYSLLMQETNQWAGDFENTSDSLANQQRKLTGEIENLQATLGQQLLPTATEVTSTLVELATVTGDVVEQIQAAGQKVPPELKMITDAAWALSVPMLAIKGPIKLVSTGLDKLGLSAEESAEKVYASSRRSGREIKEAAKASAIEVEDMADTMSDAADIIQSQIKGAAMEFEQYGSSIEKYRADNEAAAEATEQAAEDMAAAMEDFRTRVETATSGATSSVFNFTDETLEDVDAWQAEMLERAGKLKTWQDQLLVIAESTSVDFALHLADMGEAGMGLVEELANSDDELQESFDKWQFTTFVAGRDMAALFDQIGKDSAAGLAAGLKAGWPQVNSALASEMDATMREAKARWGVQSPSKVFAEEIGEPIAQGIAKGIEDDGQKIADALRDQIENATETALDALDELVDAADDALDGLFDERDQKEKIEDLTEGLSDAYADLAEEEAKRGTDAFDPEKLADAQEKVKDTAFKLFEETIRDPDRQFGRKSNEHLFRLGEAAGLTREEIQAFITAATDLRSAEVDRDIRGGIATASGDSLIAAVDRLVAAIGAPGGTALTGGYTINLNGFANEQSIQMLIDAINEVRRREAGAA